MGYYSNFEIATEPDIDSSILIKLLQDNTGYGGAYYDSFRDCVCLDNCKWYSCSDDMGEISEEITNTLFTIKAYGEEDEDITISYAKDGNIEFFKAEITFPRTTLT